MLQPWSWFLLLLSLLMWGSTSLIAQSARVVYPVKKDHLWGFISRRGEMLIPPRYDAIGEPLELLVPAKAGPSPEYRLVEVNGELGVINHHLEEVIPCSYDYILPVSSSQILVRQTEGYTIVDTSGQSLSGLYFDHLEFAGATGDGTCLYRFKQQQKIGLINAQGDTLLPGEYAQIKVLKWYADLFLTRKHSSPNWTLTAEGGKVIMSGITEAQGPHPSLLLVRKEGQKSPYLQAVTRQAAPFTKLDSMRFSKGEYLTPALVLLQSSTLDDQTGKTTVSQHLFNVEEETLIHLDYLSFDYLDGQYCAATAWRPVSVGRAKLSTILDTQGKPVNNAGWYRSIAVWPGSAQKYRVFDRYGYGIVDQRGELIVPAEYHKIGPVIDGLATIQLNGRLGLITAEGTTVVPAEYTRIRRKGNRLTLEKNDSTKILYLDDSFNVIKLEEYQRMRTLNVAAPPTKLRMASHAAWERLFSQSFGVANSLAPPSNLADTTRLNRWFCTDNPVPNVVTDLFPWPKTAKLGLHHDFLRKHRDYNLSNFDFIRFFVRDTLSLRRYSHLSKSNIKLVPQHLFSETAGTLFPEAVAGIRGSDFREGSSLAATLATDGRIFLLRNDGSPLRNEAGEVLYFSFVGTWEKGLLRVCVGGKLTEEETNEGSRETLPTYRSFLLSFGPRLASSPPKEGGKPLVMRALANNQARWGVIDTNGRWVIPLEYDYLSQNIGGQMVARKEGRYGVIDHNHQVIVPFDYLAIRTYQQYWRVNSRPIGHLYFNWRGHQIMDADTEDARFFREGYCARQVNGYWHYIDTNGKPIGQDSFLNAKSFGEGFAAVRLDSTQWGFIDTSGVIRHHLPSGRFHNLGYFVEGRCWFQRGAAFGFLDTSMQEVIPARYKEVSDFDRGRAIVRSHNGIAIIDSLGNTVMSPGQYSNLSDWNDQHLAVATVPREGQFLVDSLGRPLHQQAYERIDLRGEGPYGVKRGYYWGYIDKQGREVVPLRYREVQAFHEGIAAVKPTQGGDLWQFINTAGQSISQKRYDQVVAPFHSGLALVKNRDQPPFLLNRKGSRAAFPFNSILFKDGALVGCQEENKAFFTDLDGNPVFSRTFDKIEPFGPSETTAVIIGSGKGIVDRRGMLLLGCKYFKFEPRPDGTYLVGPRAFGIYDREGQVVVPPEFDDLQLLEGDIFRVERGEKVGYLETDGKIVWPLQN